MWLEWGPDDQSDIWRIQVCKEVHLKRSFQGKSDPSVLQQFWVFSFSNCHCLPISAHAEKEISSVMLAHQWTEQTIPSATEHPLSICSICLIVRDKGIKIKKEKKKSGRGRTFHKCVIWTGIIASPCRLIFKYTWVRNNSTPQSSCGHTVYSPFWLKSLFLCQQFLMQNHLNVC